MSRIMPAMSDSGRCFTSFTSRCEINNRLQSALGARTQTEYRKALQTEGAVDVHHTIFKADCMPYHAVVPCHTTARSYGPYM